MVKTGLLAISNQEVPELEILQAMSSFFEAGQGRHDQVTSSPILQTALADETPFMLEDDTAVRGRALLVLVDVHA